MTVPADDTIADAFGPGRDAPVSTMLPDKFTTGDRYDAGLLNDFGGGDVGWWQDYLRAELDRSHDFYTDVNDQLSYRVAALEAAIRVHLITISQLHAERDVLYNAGIAEIAARNSSVMAYMRHWEGRAETAERTAPAFGPHPPLPELQRLCDAATRGPWTVMPREGQTTALRINPEGRALNSSTLAMVYKVNNSDAGPHNAALIALAPQLAARVIADAKERERVVEVLASLLRVADAGVFALPGAREKALTDARALLNDMAKEAGK